MRKTRTKEFEVEGADGEKMILSFTVAQMPATRATRISQKLVRSVIPALGRAGKGFENLDLSKGLANAKIDLSSILSALGDGAQALFAVLSEDEFEKLWKELFEFATVTVGEKTAPLMKVFDEVLAGEQLLFFKLLAFALEVNFQDFFRERAGSLDPVANALLSRILGISKTPSPSGASS